jgi:protein-tyrosine phosphatase
VIDAPHVDFVPLEGHGIPGRLGLTCVPGSWRDGAAADQDRRVSDDVRSLVTAHGADVLVTLLEGIEIAERLGPRFRERARRAGLEPITFPIADGWVPTSIDAACALVARLVTALRAGKTVVVHCLAGLGRTGTIAACCLVALGRSPPDAIAEVRAARPGALQNPTQERFVVEFAARWRAEAAADHPATT